MWSNTEIERKKAIFFNNFFKREHKKKLQLLSYRVLNFTPTLHYYIIVHFFFFFFTVSSDFGLFNYNYQMLSYSCYKRVTFGFKSRTFNVTRGVLRVISKILRHNSFFIFTTLNFSTKCAHLCTLHKVLRSQWFYYEHATIYRLLYKIYIQ